MPQIVVSGTAQRITTQGNEWVFRSAVPDRKLVGDMVDFINEKMPKLKRFDFSTSMTTSAKAASTRSSKEPRSTA